MLIDGMKVKDATEPRKLRITTRDCSLATFKTAEACAAARAVCRWKGVKEARVHLSRVYIRIGNVWYRYGTSRPLRSEIIAADRGGKFQPGDYWLEGIKPSQRGPQKKRSRRLDGSRPQKRLAPHVVQGIRPRGIVEFGGAGA